MNLEDNTARDFTSLGHTIYQMGVGWKAVDNAEAINFMEPYPRLFLKVLRGFIYR
jgi:hypothetical protein